jgi:putative FmdB family regulatory protein
MPIYEYKCEECGKDVEIMQRITECPLTICPNCGGKMKKMISNTSFVLKGTGWYATDYADKTKKNTSEPSASAPAKTETKTGAGTSPSAKE